MGNLLMFYDTETTDKTDFNAAYNAPHQPNLIQLGYKVVEPKTRNVIFEVGHLVDTTKFPSWNGIAPGAFAKHGIRQELLEIYGLQPDKVMKAWQRWAEACDMFIAHNDQFDAGVVQCFAQRSQYNPSQVFRDAKKFCTMKTSTDICCVPYPNGRGGNKWPSLEEAYKFFNGGTMFSGAHSALPDVNACENIFWHLVDGGHVSVSW